jgi:hypothetical protein
MGSELAGNTQHFADADLLPTHQTSRNGMAVWHELAHATSSKAVVIHGSCEAAPDDTARPGVD